MAARGGPFQEHAGGYRVRSNEPMAGSVMTGIGTLALATLGQMSFQELGLAQTDLEPDLAHERHVLLAEHVRV